MKCRARYLVIGSLVVALLGLGTGDARGQDSSIVGWGSVVLLETPRLRISSL